MRRLLSSMVTVALAIGAAIVATPFMANAAGVDGGDQLGSSKYQDDVLGFYGWSSLNGYDTRPFKGNVDEAKRRVKVEAISDEDSNFEQKWRITFNDKGFLNSDGTPMNGNDYNQGAFKSNPYFGILISDDRTIVGETRWMVHDREKDNNPNSQNAPGIYAGPLKTYDDKEFWTTPIWSGYDQDRLQGGRLIKRERNLTVGTDNISALQDTLNDDDAGHAYFRFGYLKGKDESYGNPDRYMNDVGTLFGTYLYTSKKYYAKSANVVVEFTTKRDPKRFYEGEHRSFVAGEYNSWDWNSNDIRVVSKYVDIDTKTDSDGDGITDAQERFIGSDPHKKDTDGDGREDGQEVSNRNPFLPYDETSKLYKVVGTDPTVAPPTLPDRKFFGVPGEIITGKAKPFQTIALWTYQDGKAKSAVAETIADKDGNYKLEVGKLVDRLSSRNQYNNNIRLENGGEKINGNYVPVYKKGDVDIKPGMQLELTSWSDGFDGRPLFSKPEIAVNRGEVINIENFELKPPVPVKNKKQLTPEEKTKVIDAIKDNPKVKDVIKGDTPTERGNNIKVGDDGSVTLTLKDGTTHKISGDKIVVEKPSKKDLAKPGKPVSVSDPKHLTDADKEKIKKAVAGANPGVDPKNLTVGDDGSVKVSGDPAYNDGSVTPDLEKSKKDLAKPGKPVSVSDPNKLSRTGTIGQTVALLALLSTGIGLVLVFSRYRKENK